MQTCIRTTWVKFWGWGPALKFWVIKMHIPVWEPLTSVIVIPNTLDTQISELTLWRLIDIYNSWAATSECPANKEISLQSFIRWIKLKSLSFEECMCVLGLCTLPWNSGFFKWVIITDCKFINPVLYNSVFLNLLRMKKSILTIELFTQF